VGWGCLSSRWRYYVVLLTRLVDEALVLGQLLYEAVFEVKHVLDVLLVRVRVRGWG